jgi:UDP-GlcNAc:undecaprenyl-phosphate GlcNAc-1-phosphate transferase
MTTWSLAFLCALAASTVMTAIVRRCAHHFGWIEQAGVSSRKVHERPTPRVGGIAIVVGFLGPLVGLLFVDSGVGSFFRAQPGLVWGLFGGGVAVAGLGLYDDLRGVPPLKKLGVQAAIAGLMWCLGLRVEVIAAPIIGDTSLGILGLPLTLLWVVGVINAMNLIDGLDGLAGGIAFVAVATNFVLAFSRDDVLMCLIMASLGGAILGFLIFNFNPASIFMGDTGSMFLGFVLAVSSIQTSQKGGTAFCVLVPVLALGLPIMDTLLAIGRRARRGRGIFSADKEHIHHRMMSRFSLSHRDTVLVLYVLSALFAFGALELAYGNSARCGIVLAAVGVLMFAVMRVLGYVGLHSTQQASQVRRRTLRLRGAVRDAVVRLRTVAEASEVREALRPAIEAMGACRFAVELPSLEAHDREAVILEGADAEPSVRVFEVAVEADPGRLRVAWQDGRFEIDRDHELALETLAEAAAEAAMRIGIGADRRVRARAVTSQPPGRALAAARGRG